MLSVPCAIPEFELKADLHRSTALVPNQPRAHLRLPKHRPRQHFHHWRLSSKIQNRAVEQIHHCETYTNEGEININKTGRVIVIHVKFHTSIFASRGKIAVVWCRIRLAIPAQKTKPGRHTVQYRSTSSKVRRQTTMDRKTPQLHSLADWQIRIPPTNR